jgi:hypothetical protein
MIKKMRRALETKGYTADEIELLLKSLTELLDKLRKETRTSGARQLATDQIIIWPNEFKSDANTENPSWRPTHFPCKNGSSSNFLSANSR